MGDLGIPIYISHEKYRDCLMWAHDRYRNKIDKNGFKGDSFETHFHGVLTEYALVKFLLMHEIDSKMDITGYGKDGDGHKPDVSGIVAGYTYHIHVKSRTGYWQELAFTPEEYLAIKNDHFMLLAYYDGNILKNKDNERGITCILAGVISYKKFDDLKRDDNFEYGPRVVVKNEALSHVMDLVRYFRNM